MTSSDKQQGFSSSACRIRLRLSAHDAHYAGELVDGARVLGLFGDVATELLIRHDGDEGLFRAYESIEFLAPLFAGDYVEAVGEIERVGKTSRTMRFAAYKVVGNVRGGGVPASTGEVFEPQTLVARARGTCVVPLELQRFRHQRLALPNREERALPPSTDIILTAAIVGAEVTRANNPYVPFTPEEIAVEAAKCRDAGAAIVHLHVREDDGSPTQRAERFSETIEAIRRKTDVIIQATTGGAVGMSITERAGPLRASPLPEMATLNCGTINFGDDIFVNTRPHIRALAEHIQTVGIMPECEVYEVGHLDEAITLHNHGTLQGTLHVQFVLGVPGAMGARESTLRFLVNELRSSGIPHTWGVAAVGRHQRPMTELAMQLGGHVRVGLEDNIYVEKGVLSEGSAPLVQQAAQSAVTFGRTIASPRRAREILGLQA